MSASLTFSLGFTETLSTVLTSVLITVTGFSTSLYTISFGEYIIYNERIIEISQGNIYMKLFLIVLKMFLILFFKRSNNSTKSTSN